MRVENEYLMLDESDMPKKIKKITGHPFVDLVGLNKYSKKGDAVLSLLKLYKSDFDNKYLYRGEMAERMIGLILKRQGKKFITYDEKAKKENNYDFFPDYKEIGGIPDFEIPSEETIHEVKGKSMEKYAEIKKETPKEELYQGLMYAYMRKWPNLIMDYVFFDVESEKLLFENKKPKTLDNCKILQKKYKVNREEMEDLILEAVSYYKECIDNRRIPLKDISKKVLDYLKKEGLLK